MSFDDWVAQVAWIVAMAFGEGPMGSERMWNGGQRSRAYAMRTKERPLVAR